MKKTPGPLAPPLRSLPSLKMTALSYSLLVFDQQDLLHFTYSNTCTTFTTKNKESGKVAAMRSREHPVRKMEKSPEASSQIAKDKNFNL